VRPTIREFRREFMDPEFPRGATTRGPAVYIATYEPCRKSSPTERARERPPRNLIPKLPISALNPLSNSSTNNPSALNNRDITRELRELRETLPSLSDSGNPHTLNPWL